jgi:serine/threonine protein kinase
VSARLEEVPGYRLGAELGRGGMGVVRAATRLADGEPVAVKLLRADLAANPGYRSRLRAEARQSGAVVHPGVVRVYEAGGDEQGAWLVMELVDGPDLQRCLDDQGALDVADAVLVVEQVAEAVGVLHAAGIAHCDLKPANILLEGGLAAPIRAKVTDFGVATAAGALGDSSFAEVTGGSEWVHTASTSSGGPAGVKAGTVTYMAPEQWRGEGATRQADVYALGGVLYAALTGRSPYPQRSLTELALAVAMNPPPSPSEHGAPAQFDFVVAKAMAKRPEERFAGVAEFAEAVRAAARGELVGPAKPPVSRRYRWWLAAAVTVVAAATAVFVWWPAKPAVSQSITRTVCAETVGLRDAPDGRVIGELRRGETVTLDHHQDSGAWSLVRTPDGRRAWALNQYLRSSCS